MDSFQLKNTYLNAVTIEIIRFLQTCLLICTVNMHEEKHRFLQLILDCNLQHWLTIEKKSNFI